ncbi:MAG: DUF4397 domain-containing protein [Lawsonibacter sp.]|nr:DUF4397 domain-containing protein [Lawsonibacter sp.]
MDPNRFYYVIASAGRSASGSEPVIPLPYPSEGGPVYPGNDPAGEPVIPLPYPGEGGPVYPGNDPAGEPVIPLPYPGEGGPVYPGNDPAGEPVIPLPYPGEGGPVYPGGGTVIQPVPPSTARVRFLNAAYNYPALRILVDGSRFAARMRYASVTGCGLVHSGHRTITVTNSNGRVYLRKTIPFQANSDSTVAVINTASGLDLLQIADRCCPPSNGWSSFRVVNLAYNSGPLDVILSDGRVVYSDLRFKEAAAFKRIVPGAYQFFYADTNLAPMSPTLAIERLDPAWLGVYPPQETFGSLLLNINQGEIYTVCLLQNGSGRNNIQNLILVDQ